jgi:hypothetical protein
MRIQDFLHKLHTSPNSIHFSDTIATVDANYQFTPTRFRNGELINETGQNSGSCKLFSFAQLHGLDSAQTLACFGDYYRVDVLQHPSAEDHQNIRNFIKHGWAGIHFEGQSLHPY